MEAQENEEWRYLVQYPGYAVSSLGRVKSLAKSILRSDGVWWPVTEKILRPHREKGTGYESVGMGAKNSRKRVHRLVAEAFIPNPEGHNLVRHLNDIGYDNRVENLAWGTHGDNRRDSVRNGTWTNGRDRSPTCHKGHPFSGDNLEMKGKYRICRQCRREYKKAWRAERREKGLPAH